ncbi:hypothetical protein HN031_13800 [Nocardioides sp. zg-1308]|jgi:hypothetical protein|uniref:Uncharacterized protein n=1 Tax=Nocardioides renjunii TaxID=3095075 RepID=A0ABU5KC76_9ACTN|nr:MULTISPECIES: hypothetical protein [unclassified Nocardioides]MDZ5662568.1 hypothetical protein [Nocardioides sp. S-58]NPD05760.1 hypothetical protein [Nocardioides sp. zg-1308]WQQ23637.1 hypothetical protein SHK17_06530 [Nocardioides sp. S-34]
MYTTLRRSAHADQLEAELRDARCCDARRRCVGCQAKADEIRAARRDAIIYSLSTVRPRRPVS